MRITESATSNRTKRTPKMDLVTALFQSVWRWPKYSMMSTDAQAAIAVAGAFAALEMPN